MTFKAHDKATVCVANTVATLIVIGGNTKPLRTFLDRSSLLERSENYLNDSAEAHDKEISLELASAYLHDLGHDYKWFIGTLTISLYSIPGSAFQQLAHVFAASLLMFLIATK